MPRTEPLWSRILGRVMATWLIIVGLLGLANYWPNPFGLLWIAWGYFYLRSHFPGDAYWLAGSLVAVPASAAFAFAARNNGAAFLSAVATVLWLYPAYRDGRRLYDLWQAKRWYARREALRGSRWPQ